METITYDEQQLMAIYNTGDRLGTISAITEMRGYLEPDEPDLLTLTDSALEKLSGMTDDEFEALDLTPDFNEDGE